MGLSCVENGQQFHDLCRAGPFCCEGREQAVNLLKRPVKAPANGETLLRKHCFPKCSLVAQTRRHLLRKQNVSDQIQKRFCLRNKCSLGTQTWKHLLTQQCFLVCGHLYSNVPTTETKGPFVLTTNEALFGTLITIGDVNDVFAIERMKNASLGPFIREKISRG